MSTKSCTPDDVRPAEWRKSTVQKSESGKARIKLIELGGCNKVSKGAKDRELQVCGEMALLGCVKNDFGEEGIWDSMFRKPNSESSRKKEIKGEACTHRFADNFPVPRDVVRRAPTAARPPETEMEWKSFCTCFVGRSKTNVEEGILTLPQIPTSVGVFRTTHLI